MSQDYLTQLPGVDMNITQGFFDGYHCSKHSCRVLCREHLQWYWVRSSCFVVFLLDRPCENSFTAAVFFGNNQRMLWRLLYQVIQGRIIASWIVVHDGPGFDSC
jgi:hypothetical protein